MITTDQTTKLLKRWRKLEADQRDLDFRVSEFARDLRDVCGGELPAVAWCSTELGMTELQAKALLARGALVDVVPDAPTWNRLGGYQKIRVLEQVPTKRARVEFVEKAKSQNLQIASVIRKERAAEQQRTGVVPVQVATPREDAAVMAKFILAHVPRKEWTPHITATVARHADITQVIPKARQRKMAEAS